MSFIEKLATAYQRLVEYLYTPLVSSDDSYSTNGKILKTFNVLPYKLKQDLANDAGDLRVLISQPHRANLKQVVVLGSHEGAWNKVLVDECRADKIRCYSWWKEHERPGLAYHNAKVTIDTQDIGTVRPYECHTLLCNMRPTSAKLELSNLRQLSSWLLFRPQVFVLRVIHFEDKNVLAQLKLMQERLGDEAQVSLVKIVDGDRVAVYFVRGRNKRALQNAHREISQRLNGWQFPFGQRRQQVQIAQSTASWPIPNELPEGVEQLAPLDMGRTLAQYDKLERPRYYKKRRFMKELGSILTKYKVNNNVDSRSRIFHKLIEPLLPLIKNHSKWMLTRNDPETMEATTEEKIDRAPIENHTFYKHMWEVYKALAHHLLRKGCRLRRLTNEEIELGANKQSKMGWQDRDAYCDNMGEYLDDRELWRQQVAEVRSNLLAGHPIKADYNSCGKREAKTENRTRMIWSHCATVRLLEAQVLGSVDDLLHEIPYASFKSKPHDFGEIFNRMLAKGKHAICDDIKGWDTRISYSILCMESAFLQLLSDDLELRNEIKHLYRLYAYPLMSKVERHLDSDGRARFYKVFYQLQGQVASGRRVTYSMNTITNIVINMTRAAVSQGHVATGHMIKWALERLNESYYHSRFTGQVSGDDIVIFLGQQEAKLFAGDKGINMMNAMGLIRKSTGTGKSKICTQLSEIEFCSRKFVELNIGQEKRIVPVRPVEEIIMKKLFRDKRFGHDDDERWARQIGRDLLVDFFFLPTIRVLAFALLSATPNNIPVADDEQNNCLVREREIIHQINEKYFGEKTYFKFQFRAKTFDDLGYLCDKDLETYDLDLKCSSYKRWKKDLPGLVKELRKSRKNYDDWIEVDQQDYGPIYLTILIVLYALYHHFIKPYLEQHK